jgi:hypothetical protein
MAHAKKKRPGPWARLRKAHKALKRTRHRGDPVASALATELYLRRLEQELERVWELLARGRRSGSVEHLDEAQQRMHAIINGEARREKKRAK